ncbi:MAG: hypothetical protein LM554_01580 [Desulfurococcaceae archaeon]|jgi:hypothetical protein|nr:hypothetical protein [Desulfurococcaceae archaeon]
MSLFFTRSSITFTGSLARPSKALKVFHYLDGYAEVVFKSYVVKPP